MDLNGWTLITKTTKNSTQGARFNADYTLTITGPAAHTLAAAGGAIAYSNAEKHIAVRATTEADSTARRVTRTATHSVKFSLTQLRNLGYRVGQRFTVAQQGDLFVLTPEEARQ